MTLPIADLERCDYVVVLGGQEVIDAAPVLHLRLFKSERRGVKVLKIDAEQGARAREWVPADAQAVGILATVSHKKEATDLQAALGKKVKGSVRRLLVVRGPNGRGANDLGILPNFRPGYEGLNGQSGKGRAEWGKGGIGAAYIFEASPLHAFEATEDERRWLSGLKTLVMHRFRASPLDDLAHVIIPGRAFTEKAGTVTNMEGRVQRIGRAIDADAVPDDWMVLQAIARKLGAPWDYHESSDITADLLDLIPQYAAVDRGERVLWSERT